MRIAIIGLGLIGGSWALAIKEWAKSEEGRTAGIEVVGFDAKGSQRAEANKRKIVDHMVATPMEAVKGAQVVIVATPVMAVRETFEDIAAHLEKGAIVTDVCSTKRQVMRWAKELLPDNVSFVGGHPMAGKTAGLEEAEATLFQDCTYCLIPAPNARQEAIESVLRLVEIAGARPHFIDAYEHDSYVAAISHLPYLTATSLINLSFESDGWKEISRVAGTGFQDTTRLADGSVQMWLDICRTNNDALINWIDRYQQMLSRVRHMLELAGLQDEQGRSRPVEETEPEPLRAFLENAREGRNQLFQNKRKFQLESNFGDSSMPNSKEMKADIGRMFVGGMFKKPKKDEDNKN
ncbi:prephenate dehydrogenase/arogenate dehydrogenase family protein [Candidatus Chlorohelix sp.]|uniref:prephenate dehydrogenase n=1 Tax=Candidatus Chlorohelix sp. TaxID=3139201 RepID=UPI003021D18E